MSICKRCADDKPRTEFPPRGEVCNDCHRKAAATAKERRKARDERYRKSEKGKASGKRAMTRYRQTEKGKAASKRAKERFNLKKTEVMYHPV